MMFSLFASMHIYFILGGKGGQVLIPRYQRLPHGKQCMSIMKENISYMYRDGPKLYQ